MRKEKGTGYFFPKNRASAPYREKVACPLFCLFVLLAGIASLAVGYQLAQARLSQADVRSFVETRAREILKAEVKIGSVRYLPLARVALQEIQMDRAGPQFDFSIAQIKKLILGFGLANLIQRDFHVPGVIVLDSPRIHIHSRHALLPLLGSTPSSMKGVPAELGIRSGELHYSWREGTHELILSQVELKARPNAQGRIRLNLTAHLGGVAQGAIKIQGVTDPSFRRYELEVRLDEVSFSAQSQIPLRKIRGKFHISEKTIQMESLTSFFHGWEVQWKGRIDDWQSRPKMALDLSERKGKSPFRFSFKMDFTSGELQGEWSSIGRRTYPFHGRVAREGKKVIFPHLEMPRGYTGQGQIDFSNGDYRFELERERRRIQIRSNLSQLEFDTRFQLDHVSINDLDWVVAGRARFSPLTEHSRGAGSRFRGEVETDYFIVEYEPLQDFRGSLELSPEGAHAIDFQWGGVFQLGGRILFKGGTAREDLVLRVGGFPLESIKEFGGRPIPSNLSGILEGKLKFRGELNRPEIQGYFTIKEGTIERLDFDRAIIQFEGYPPYLRLYDSKIFKGRNTLKFTGAINFELENIFHGIEIKGPDHLVLWKGVAAYWKPRDSAIQAEKPLGKQLTMGLEVGAGPATSQGEDREESHAVLGPRAKF